MNSKGIILMEAIITTVIMAIGLTVIMQSLLNGYRSVSLQKEYSQALIQAENQLAQTLAMGKESRRNVSKFESQSVVTRKDDFLNNAVITVQWPSGQGKRQIITSSYIYAPNNNLQSAR